MGAGGVVGSVIEAAVPLEEIQVWDAEAAWRARGSGALKLRIGEALDKLVSEGALQRHFGVSGLGDYAKQYCGRSRAWAGEAKTLAHRLCSLPRLRIALKVDVIDYSMAVVLARYATPDNEDELVQRAMGSSVRAMKRWLKTQGKPEGAPPRDESDPDESGEPVWWVSLQRSWTREERLLYEMTQRGAAKHAGCQPGWQALEWMLAETAVSMINDGVDVIREDLEKEHATWRQRREQAEARRDGREARAERVVLAQRRMAQTGYVEEEPLPDDPYALHELVQQLCAELASRELFLGRLLDKIVRARGPKRLGYADEVQYARERLGMSRSTMWKHISLVRETRALPQLRDAVADGEVSYCAAERIGRVAEPETVAAWIARSKVRTYKHLLEEIDAVELVARVTGDRRALVPPSEEELAYVQAVEREVLTGELMRAVLEELEAQGVEHGFEMPANDTGLDSAGLREAFVRMSSYPGRPQEGVDPGTERLGRSRWSQRAPDDIALHYKVLETVHREAGLPGTFVQYMCLSYWKTWLPEFGKNMKWGEVFARDLFRCASPVCSERNLTGHHIRFRSAGGGDEDQNMMTLGNVCHLDNIHVHRSIGLYPPASRPMWIFGRDKTVLVVEGREKRAAS
ncbi:MAG: HNH endonuclease [Polyangiales bacterium]